MIWLGGLTVVTWCGANWMERRGRNAMPLGIVAILSATALVWWALIAAALYIVENY